MKGSTVALLVLGVAGAGAGLYFYLSKKGAAPAKAAPKASSSRGFLDNVEDAVAKKTGVPLRTIGSAAKSAPLWLKVGVFPVGVTAVAQNLISHPADTVKSAGSKVASGAKSAYHAIASIF